MLLHDPFPIMYSVDNSSIVQHATQLIDVHHVGMQLNGYST